MWVFVTKSPATDTGGLQTTHTVDLCNISGYYYLNTLSMPSILCIVSMYYVIKRVQLSREEEYCRRNTTLLFFFYKS